MELVDLGHTSDLVGIVAVMGKRMMGIRNAYLWVGTIAGLSGQLKGDHTGDISLIGQTLKIEHETGMVRISGRHADGSVQVRQRMISY